MLTELNVLHVFSFSYDSIVSLVYPMRMSQFIEPLLPLNSFLPDSRVLTFVKHEPASIFSE